MEISDYAHYAVLLSLQLKRNLRLRSLHCFASLLLKWNIWLRSLRCFTSLTTPTTLPFFAIVKTKSVTTLTTLFQFTIAKMKYLTTLAKVFLLLLLLKWILWLRSLHCFTSLLLTLEIALPSPTLLLSLTHQIVFPRNFSISIKFVCATVIWLLGSSVESYMLYYPLYLRWNECLFWNTNQFTAEFMISITRGVSLWNRHCY